MLMRIDNPSQGLRELMPALSNKVYFNYGGQGPLPIPSLEAITNSWIKIQELGPFTENLWPYISKEILSTKALLGNCCGVAPHRIALTENVTSGCILPTAGIPFKEGDRILIGDCEHPGIIASCKEIARKNKLIIDKLPVKELRAGFNKTEKTNSNLLEILERSLQPKTRLVVLSHLLWNTGQLMPIDLVGKLLLKHPYKPYLLVDAAQSFCQVEIEEAVKYADIYAFTGHKWACGPEGLGGVCLSERILEEANPTIIGWKSLKNEDTYDLLQENEFHKDARRFEVSTTCIPLLAGLRASIQLINSEGTAKERLQKILNLSEMLWNSLDKAKGIYPLLEGTPPAGLISFQFHETKNNERVLRELGRKGIWIRGLEAPKCLRACVHITSLPSEVNMLSEELPS